MEYTISSPETSLASIRPKAVDLAQFNPIRESQLSPDLPLPLIIEPAAMHVDLADWTGELTFFNQVQLHHVNCLDLAVRESLLSIFKRQDLPRHVYFGDGSEIENAVMDHIGETHDKNAARFTWREGDLVLLTTCYRTSRDSYVGPRKIIVAVGDVIDGVDVGLLA